jgi:hypothetical protein
MDHEKWLEQHDRMMADHDLWLARHEEAMARHQEWLARHEEAMARQEEAAARHDREMALIREGQRKTEEILRRAIRVGVKEARQQRKRHQELEVLLKAFLERGGNGKH